MQSGFIVAVTNSHKQQYIGKCILNKSLYFQTKTDYLNSTTVSHDFKISGIKHACKIHTMKNK